MYMTLELGRLLTTLDVLYLSFYECLLFLLDLHSLNYAQCKRNPTHRPVVLFILQLGHLLVFIRYSIISVMPWRKEGAARLSALSTLPSWPLLALHPSYCSPLEMSFLSMPSSCLACSRSLRALAPASLLLPRAEQPRFFSSGSLSRLPSITLRSCPLARLPSSAHL